MTEPSREAFEKWAVGILGDNPNWCESGDCELAWQSWRASRETEQAQAVEPIGYVRHADKTFWPHPECAVYASVSPSLAPVYAHPAPTPAEAQQVAVPMTEAQIFECDPVPHVMFDQQRIDFARAIEAHHGIGAKP